jgi:hypothetical protein
MSTPCRLATSVWIASTASGCRRRSSVNAKICSYQALRAASCPTFAATIATTNASAGSPHRSRAAARSPGLKIVGS